MRTDSVSPKAGYDCNYDNTSLEVIHNDQVILQVEMKNGAALIRGVFYNVDGASTVFSQNTIQFNQPGTVPTIHFEPIFRHPGYKYFGERVF